MENETETQEQDKPLHERLDNVSGPTGIDLIAEWRNLASQQKLPPEGVTMGVTMLTEVLACGPIYGAENARVLLHNLEWWIALYLTARRTQPGAIFPAPNLNNPNT